MDSIKLKNSSPDCPMMHHGPRPPERWPFNWSSGPSRVVAAFTFQMFCLLRITFKLLEYNIEYKVQRKEEKETRGRSPDCDDPSRRDSSRGSGVI